MNVLKRTVLAAACLMALSGIASAQTTSTTTTTASTTSSTSLTTAQQRLVTQYATFVGSTSNAESLVKGLSSGTSVRLKSGSTTASGGSTSSGTTSGTTSTTSTSTNVSFTPPTGKMGTGNVNIALSLAQKSLAEQGITEPSPQQLQTALMGGSLSGTSGTKPTEMQGVLQMRADGMGWGKIANELGFKLGDAMRSSNAQAQRAAAAEKSGGSAQVARVDRADKAQRVERAERADRPQKVERPEKIERVERVERPVRPERPERHGR